MKNIPFNKPFISEQEKRYVIDSLEKEKISGDGYYSNKTCQLMQKVFNINKILLTTSCSSALDMAGILLGLKDGDEVILPSYTFVSTANAVLSRGATPVFVDIEEDTLNINPMNIEEKINSRTKAIFAVHYGGISCNMGAILEISQKYGLKVVEDAAQGVNAKYQGKYLGTLGDIGTYSFHDTKNYTCGEGGALLINKDEELMKRAEIIREKGTDRSKFIRGEVDKYTWIDIGSSYLISDILAAILYGQLERLEEIKTNRKHVFDFYYNNLEYLENIGALRRQIIPENCESNYHMFFIILNSEKERNYLMRKLRENGIGVASHYIPLHTSPMGMKLGYKEGDLEITEDLSRRLLRLPLYVGLVEEELDYIVNSIFEVLT